MSQFTTAAATLSDEFNAHIVLCDDEKKPHWDDGPYRWKRRRPSSEVIESHPQKFGIVPWSVRTTGLDVDHGEPLQLSLLTHPLANLPTPRGHHLYCADTQPRRNAHFDAAGCSGDVRGSNGYLVLHYDGAARLLDALRRRDDWNPRDLWELVNLAPGPVRVTATARLSHPREQTAPSVIAPIEAATEGMRWSALRQHMGRIVRVTNRPRPFTGGPVFMREWHTLVEGMVLEARDRMPRPRLPMGETLRLSYLLSTWFASGGRRDGSSESQSWRGKRSHGGGRPRLYATNAERQRAYRLHVRA